MTYMETHQLGWYCNLFTIDLLIFKIVYFLLFTLIEPREFSVNVIESIILPVCKKSPVWQPGAIGFSSRASRVCSWEKFEEIPITEVLQEMKFVSLVRMIFRLLHYS